jgi:hypothetical protein
MEITYGAGSYYEWRDLKIGNEISCRSTDDVTVDGKIIAMDRANDLITIEDKEGKTHKTTISQVYLELGQIKPALTHGVGQFILLFGIIEIELREMVLQALSINEKRHNIIFSKGGETAGTLVEKVALIIKATFEENSPERKEWDGIRKDLMDLLTIRNNLIHGYRLESYSGDGSGRFAFINPKEARTKKKPEDIDWLNMDTLEEYIKKADRLRWHVSMFFYRCKGKIIKYFSTDSEDSSAKPRRPGEYGGL